MFDVQHVEKFPRDCEKRWISCACRRNTPGLRMEQMPAFQAESQQEKRASA